MNFHAAIVCTFLHVVFVPEKLRNYFGQVFVESCSSVILTCLA